MYHNVESVCSTGGWGEQASHGDLRDNHFEESREGREDTVLVLVETETSSRAKVATLHDTGGDKDLGVLLVNDLQAGRALEIT